jgi:hypothetical protein
LVEAILFGPKNFLLVGAINFWGGKIGDHKKIVGSPTITIYFDRVVS